MLIKARYRTAIKSLPVAFSLWGAAGRAAEAPASDPPPSPVAEELAEEGNPAGRRGNDILDDDGPTSAGKPKAAESEPTGLHRFLPGAYVLLEVRHWTLRSMERDSGGLRPGSLRLLDSPNVGTDNTNLCLRPTVGSTFFDGKVDSFFTYVLADRIGTAQVYKADLFNNTQWNLIDGKFNADSPYFFGPTAYVDFFNGRGRSLAFNYADLGVTGEANLQLPIPTGQVSLKAYVNPALEVYSAEQKRHNRARLVLDPNRQHDDAAPVAGATKPEDPATTQQHDAYYVAYYGTAATYLPSAVPDLALTLGLDVIEVWKPVYKEEGPSNEPANASLSHYVADAVSYGRFTLKYKLSERLTLVNQTRHYLGGVFDRTISQTRPETTGQVGPYSWENRLSLVVTLY